MEELFILNPEILNFKKKYMRWNGSRENCRIFQKLLAEAVYINGFVNDNFTGQYLCNKPFAEENEIKFMNHACIIASADIPCPCGQTQDIQPYILNPCVSGRKVMIYGCGENGKTVLGLLKEYAVQIAGFIDSNREGMMDSYKIYPPESMENMDSDMVIILAASQYSDMEKKVRTYLPEIKCVFYDCFHLYFKCGQSMNYNDMSSLNQVCKITSTKNVYLYGRGSGWKAYISFLRMLDIELKGILTDSGSETIENHFGLKTYAVEEILPENDIYILIGANDEQKAVYELEHLGLEAVKDYLSMQRLIPQKYYFRKTALDMNLGYTYIGRTGEYGLTKFPAGKKERYRIFTLGSSTTDGELYPFKSWPECLWDRIDHDYISVYNYGVAGYTVGQELLKLMRDIAARKPDMVLALNGMNDYYRYAQNLFAFDYLQQVMRSAAPHLTDHFINQEDICSGEKTFEDNFSRWLSTVELMHAITRLYGIPFIDFLEPMLFTKPRKSKEEMMIYMQYDDYVKSNRSFRECFSGLNEKYDYIVDLSDIFDDIDYVYMDIGHVCERGNEIIAEKIYDSVSSILEEWTG